jgi:elongation factor G
MFGWPDGFIPIVEIEIASSRDADRDVLIAALSELGNDDRFAFKAGATGPIVIAGTDERDLERSLEELRRKHPGSVTIGPPQIAYRETVTQSASIDYTHKKQVAGAGEFARVMLAVAPGADGVATFRSEVGGTVPTTHVAGVGQGIEDGLLAGVVAGFPVIDIAIVLKDCAYHEIDSSRQAFHIAGLRALREALAQAAPVLLEPIMTVAIEVPAESVARIASDLRSRRGVIKQRVDIPPDGVSIVALVPAANLLGYALALRAMSRGRASYEASFDRYAPVPPDPPFSPAVGMRA